MYEYSTVYMYVVKKSYKLGHFFINKWLVIINEICQIKNSRKEGEYSDLLYTVVGQKGFCEGDHGGIIKWSGKGGRLVLRRVAGVHCVRYIGDCTARFATGTI